MNATTVVARGAAALVAVIAGAASFEHIASVAIGAGERPWVAYSLPFAVDGLIVVGVSAMIEDKRSRRVPRLSARLAVAIGVLATLAANIASAEPTVTARLVAVAAPVAFLLAVEVLTRTGRLRTVGEPGEQLVDALLDEPAAAGLALVDAEQVEPAPQREPADVEQKPARRPGRRPSAADRVARAAARTPGATPAQIAARLDLSERTVQRYLPRPAGDMVTTPA